MVFDFDLRLFCENLKATKPPYQCPAPGCNRVYKTYIGIQFHLFNYDHENPDGKSSSTPANNGQQKRQDAVKKGHHRQVRCPSSPNRVSQEESEHELSSSLSPHNVSTKSQRVIEVTLDGQVHRIDVYEPMNVQVRQQQQSAFCKSVDDKPPELVLCTAVPVKTQYSEPLPGASVIDDPVPAVSLSDACSSPTPNFVVTSDSLAAASKHCVADTPVENAMAMECNPELTETSCTKEGYDDTKDSDVNKVTDSAVDDSLLALEQLLPSDNCTINNITSAASNNSVANSDATVEVKTETNEEPVKPSVECCDKNAPCSDDASATSPSSALINSSTVSTTCAKSAECDTVSSCSTSSTAVVSKSAPTKLSLPSAEFKVLNDYVRPPKISATEQTAEYYKFTERTAEELDTVVEYDMDEEVYFISMWFWFSEMHVSYDY